MTKAVQCVSMRSSEVNFCVTSRFYRFTVTETKKNGVGLKVEVKQEENIIHPAQLLLSQVFLLDLSLMPYYRHRVWVNTSAETSPHDKWTELNSACAQYHLWRVRHWVLLYRSHRKQVLRACPLQSFPQIFFSSFSPLHQLFSFHLAGLHQ